LDVYFRQCSLLVSARDLAVMGATLANNGVNPLTGEQVMKPYVVARTLSIMTSSGMYDYAGEWVYRIGMPAKSGVGGGIVAALPAQLGLGSFAPRLDEHGNSVRGIRICEALSTHFGLHMLNRSADVRTSIMADYDIGAVRSRRSRLPRDQKILADHHKDVRVVELAGAHSFASMDYVCRRLGQTVPSILILDFRRVASITTASALLLADLLRSLIATNRMVILAGLEPKSLLWAGIDPLIRDISDLRVFPLLDHATEWAEDQLIIRHGGRPGAEGRSDLKEQAMLAGLASDELASLAKLGTRRYYRAGQRIIAADEPASSLFFLQSGMVSVKLGSGVRLATLEPGMEFGEMALLDERHRTADVWADTDVCCLELPVEDFNKFRREHPHVGERIARNLAAILAKRLILTNAKIDLLSA
jgi:glutaminase